MVSKDAQSLFFLCAGACGEISSERCTSLAWRVGERSCSSLDGAMWLYYKGRIRDARQVRDQSSSLFGYMKQQRYPHSYQQNVENYVDIMLLSESSE